MKTPSRIVTSDPTCTVACFEQEKVARLKEALAKQLLLLPQLANFHKLLGNVTRLKILLALGQGELCVCDVAHVLGLTVAATSHQLKLLREQGLLTMRHDGKMVYYRLQEEELLATLQGELRALKKRPA